MTGEDIKKVRAVMGMTLRECAEKLDINDKWLSQIENGRVEPSLKIQTKILTQIIDTPEYTEKLRYLAQIGANENARLEKCIP